MTIDIICISNKQNDWILHGIKTYLARLPKWLTVNVILISPVKDKPNKATKLLKEAQKIQKKITSNDHLVILDSSGLPLDNSTLLDQFQKLRAAGLNIKVLIGGADGLDDSLKTIAQSNWSISRLIFPHSLCLLVFLEQIYRTTSIINNHPYHR